MSSILTEMKHAKTTARILAATEIIVFIILAFILYPTIYRHTSANYKTNLFYLMQLILIIVPVLLSGFLGDTYWIINRKKNKLDERQLAVRRKVFEISFKILVLLLIVGSFSIVLSGGNLALSKKFNDGSMLTFPVYPLAMLLYSLPSVVGAWLKEA